MVRQPKNYISKQKKKHGWYATIWGSCILILFSLGLFVMSTKENNMTLVAALLVVPFGIHLTRYIAYGKYIDPHLEDALLLENIKGNYIVFHSAIIPLDKTTLYFPHIVVTNTAVYFFSKNEPLTDEHKRVLEDQLLAKGYIKAAINYMYIPNQVCMIRCIEQIEKEAYFSDERLDYSVNLISTMMM